jgi:hypothetical protein
MGQKVVTNGVRMGGPAARLEKPAAGAPPSNDATPRGQNPAGFGKMGADAPTPPPDAREPGARRKKAGRRAARFPG